LGQKEGSRQPGGDKAPQRMDALFGGTRMLGNDETWGEAIGARTLGNKASNGKITTRRISTGGEATGWLGVGGRPGTEDLGVR